jgi:hypothetical protein
MIHEPDTETRDLTEALHWRYAAKRMNGGKLSGDFLNPERPWASALPGLAFPPEASAASTHC